jgi:heterotetrameric sarcosine oxidase gamma subunit
VPDFESAVLTTYSPVTDAPLSLSDISATSKTLVRSDQPQFGVVFGHSVAVGEALVAGTRPDEWLILGADEAVDVAADLVNAEGFTNVIGFTHGRSLFRATGDPSAAMLEKVCGIDWSNTMTPDGAVVSASVALVGCDIVRNDVEGSPSYLLMCDRSFGQYLFDALVDAGSEFGISVD